MSNFLPTIKFNNFTFEESKGYPTPSVTTSINKERSSSYQYIGSMQSITLNGFIVDDSTQELLVKAYDLKDALITAEPAIFLFSINNRSIISGTGFVKSLSFDTEKNNGVQILTYSVNIDFDNTATGVTTINNSNKKYLVSNVGDNLTIKVSDQKYVINNKFYPLYEITRNISAQGKYVKSSGSLIEAMNWINDRRTFFPLTTLLPSNLFPLFNHTRNIELDELQGNIAITDNYISKPLNSNNAWIDSYTINTSIAEDLTNSISIKGKVIGLVPATGNTSPEDPITLQHAISGRNVFSPFNKLTNSTTKYSNAYIGYSTITGILGNRARDYYNSLLRDLPIEYTYPYAKLPLNTDSPINFVESFNPFNGEITYDISYNNKPSFYINGALSELITVTDNAPLPRISSIPVLGRRLGPVVYFLPGASGLGKRSVTYEGVFLQPTGIGSAQISSAILNDIDNLVEKYKPSLIYESYIVENNQKININDNRIIRSKTWSYIPR